MQTRYWVFSGLLLLLTLGAVVAGKSYLGSPIEETALAVPQTAPQKRTLRIAMSAAFVSQRGVDVYELIARYLERKTRFNVEFITGLGYRTINSMLSSGALDSAFICGLPYVLLNEGAPSVRLLVAPVMKAARYEDKPVYYSDLIVHKDSALESIHDLRGKTLAFNEEISNSGYNMPRFKLLEIGETDGFFSKVLRSGSHEESIRMVANQQVDAAFVDSLVLDYDTHLGSKTTSQVKVVESLGPVAIPPLVVSDNVDDVVYNELAQILLSMHEDSYGRKILDRALVKRFVRVEDKDYQSIRLMYDRALDEGFTKIR